MDDNFSPRVKEVLSHSKDEALRLGHDFIGTEHLLLGILKDGSGKAISILDQLDIDLDHLRRKVEILSPSNTEGLTSNDKKKLAVNSSGRTRH
jgi:ATP-dependent Clp protease ATP-binding subunit ClpC